VIAMKRLKEIVRRKLWLFAVQHCRPVAFTMECPQLVFSNAGHTWIFTALKGKPYVLLPSKQEVIPLNAFLTDALHYLNENPGLADPTIHERLCDIVRGKSLLKMRRVA